MGNRSVTRMTIYDALHYSPEQAARIIASYPKHVRRARAEGLPAIGEGAVYPIDDEDLVVPDFEIPRHWSEIGGLDFGWDHPTAAVRHVFNPDSGILYVVQEYREREVRPIEHVATLKGWGLHLPFSWGMEGLQTTLSDDPKQKKQVFAGHGLRLLDTHATFDEGGVGVERGVTEIYELMTLGKFKVFKSCRKWLEEKSTYHRVRKADDKVAMIHKVGDDLMDASRYAYMMRRFSVPVAWRARFGGRPRQLVNNGKPIDTRDIFG